MNKGLVNVKIKSILWINKFTTKLIFKNSTRNTERTRMQGQLPGCAPTWSYRVLYSGEPCILVFMICISHL